jgi:CBS domain-containing protein
LHTPAITFAALPSCLAVGTLGGLLAAGLSATLYKIEDGFHKLPLHWMWWPAIGGLGVGIGGYFEPRALGVGYDVISDLLNNHLAMEIALSLILVKAIIWTLALGSGTSGGVLAPVLMIGAGLGVVLAPLLPGGDPHLWALIGMATVFAGIFGVPLTATVFAIELTYEMNALLPLLLACGISYGVTTLLMKRSILTEKIARRGLHIYREYGVDPLERQNVGDLMTREVQTIPAQIAVAEALAQYFGPQQKYRGFPVIDTAGKVIGMVERSVLFAQNDGTRLVGALFGAHPPLIALPNETCRVAAARMAVHEVERLPVVDDIGSNHLIGILSRSDLIKPAREFFDEEQKRERFLGKKL